jgi:hypothetical protein
MEDQEQDFTKNEYLMDLIVLDVHPQLHQEVIITTRDKLT